MHVKDLVKQTALSAHIFSIEGDDAYFTKLAEDYFVGLVPAGLRELNVTFIDKFDVDVLKQALSAYPMGSQYTVTIVKDSVTRLKSKGGDDDDAVDKSLMGPLLRAVPDDCVLVFENPKFLAPSDRLQTEVVSSARLETRDLRSAVQSLFSCGIKFAALDKLIEYAQRDMARIESEAAKLADYAQGREITVDDIEQMVVPDSEYRVYEFTNALVEGRRGDAARIMDAMLKQGYQVGYLSSSVLGAYRKLLHCALSPLSDAELASIFKVKEYAVKKQRETAERYTKMRLKVIADRLALLEYKSRNGQLSEAGAFKRMMAFLYEA